MGARRDNNNDTGMKNRTTVERKSILLSSIRRHTRLQGDWSSDVCSSDLGKARTIRSPRDRIHAAGVSTRLGADFFFRKILQHDLHRLVSEIDQRLVIPGDEIEPS